MKRLVYVFIALLILPRFASASEYRRVELSSGRVLVAQIAATRADGLDLRTPQGIVAIRFEEVQRIDPIDQTLFDQQPPMRVLVLPSPSSADPAENATVDAALRAEIATLPFTRVQDRSDVGGQSANVLPSLTACGEDTACLVGAAAGLDVDVVFVSTGSGQGRWVRAVFPTSPDADGGVPIINGTLQTVVYALLRLQAPVADAVALPGKAGPKNRTAPVPRAPRQPNPTNQAAPGAVGQP